MQCSNGYMTKVFSAFIQDGCYRTFLQDKRNLGILMNFSQVQTSGNDSWYRAITVEEFSRMLEFYLFFCVCQLFNKILFFSLTQKKYCSSFSFPSSWRQKSIWLIPLDVTGILCHGLKICRNLLLVTCWIFIRFWFTWMYAADVIGHMYCE